MILFVYSHYNLFTFNIEITAFIFPLPLLKKRILPFFLILAVDFCFLVAHIFVCFDYFGLISIELTLVGYFIYRLQK